MSCSNIVSMMAMSHNNSRLDEVLRWLLNCSWKDLSFSYMEDCLDKMIYRRGKVVTSLSYSALIKDNIELVISAVAEIGRSVGMVMEGVWRPCCPGNGDGGQAGQGGGVA